MPIRRKSLRRKSLRRKSLKRKSLKRSLRKRVSGGGWLTSWFNKTDEDKFKDTSDLYNRLQKMDPKNKNYKKLMQEYKRKIKHDEIAKFADRVNKALDDPNYWD